MKAKAIIGLVFATCLCGCATGSGEIEHRISRLERLNGMLEQDLSAAEGRIQAQNETHENLLTTSAELKATVDELRANIQILTGRLEELDYLIRKDSRTESDTEQEAAIRLNRIEQIARTNKDRIASVEQYLDFEPTVWEDEDVAATDIGVTSVQSVDDEDLSEAELYSAGKQAFDNGQYETAREKFQEFLAKFSKSENADNAQFWIGEIYYREKWYTKAISEYQKVIENYPDGNKVPASLLKQGLSFYNLEEQYNARSFLQEVINRYPTSNEAKIARDKLKTF